MRQAIERCQFPQHVARESSAAGAKFDDVGDAAAQNLRCLPRQRATEQGAEFWRRDEIAARAELGRPGAVITESGRMQGEFHIARETDPAAAGSDFTGNQLVQSRAMREGVGGGQGKLRQMGG